MHMDEARASRCAGQAAKTSDDSFGGFPARTMLESGNLPIEKLALLALREGQATSPLHRVHRWFARRLGSQFRGILVALSLPECSHERFWDRYFGQIPLDEAIVLDPFAGGGTAVVEASRCGARVIGLDVDPVAALTARFELSAAGRAP
jgi:putative DNA methylase